jgi:L-histidine Nalpha-methyltransferase
MGIGISPRSLVLEKQEVLTTYIMPHADIIAGLSAAQASIEPKYFYDERGSALFERITALPEYYPTRTEHAILCMHGQDIKAGIATDATVIELGAGNCEKARVLCDLIKPRCFVAVDISGDFLHQAVARMREAFPALDIRAVVADIFDQAPLPSDLPPGRRLVFYPGSSIGNFDPEIALGLLRRIRVLLAEQGALLIGVDLIKDTQVLDAAYNDAAGVTAAFNLNALAHVNRLIGGNFNLHDWDHVAFFNATRSRIEMHLQAKRDLRVSWNGGGRRFREGERIHTENSYKYSVPGFTELLERAGFRHSRAWTDPQQWFAVFLAEA